MSQTNTSNTTRQLNPIRVTEWGMQVMQVRMSLRDSQAAFARRIFVHPKTVHFWECGKSMAVATYIKAAITRLADALQQQDALVPMEVVAKEYQKRLEERGNADDLEGPKVWRRRGRPTLQSDLDSENIEKRTESVGEGDTSSPRGGEAHKVPSVRSGLTARD